MHHNFLRGKIMWYQYNANPINKRVGDCTVRAISKALDQTWGKTYIEMALQGYMMCDMPSGNVVWGAYLKNNGFVRCGVPCDNCEYTVEDFCNDNPKGTYVLGTGSHAIAVIDGNHYDTWDSKDEIVLYFWKKKEI
jgi:hypothetical protein